MARANLTSHQQKKIVLLFVVNIFINIEHQTLPKKALIYNNGCDVCEREIVKKINLKEINVNLIRAKNSASMEKFKDKYVIYQY